MFDLPDAAPKESVKPEQSAQGWREVYNYREALSSSSEASVLEAPLYLIRQLHSVLLTNVRGSDRTPGAFRKTQVFIGADHRFVPPPPTHVMQCLEQFESFLKATDKSLPPIIRAFLAHYQFETIHPFLDGNGRVGRLLMTVMIRELCQHKRPWLYLSAFFDKHKNEYVDRLFSVSASADWDGWIDFCLRATIAQSKDTFDRCTRLLALREDYRKKVADRARLSAIVDMLFKNPFTRISSLQEALKVSYPTAKSDVETLAKLGIVRELPDTYPRTHYANGIYDITFFEPGVGAPPANK